MLFPVILIYNTNNRRLIGVRIVHYTSPKIMTYLNRILPWAKWTIWFKWKHIISSWYTRYNSKRRHHFFYLTRKSELMETHNAMPIRLNIRNSSKSPKIPRFIFYEKNQISFLRISLPLPSLLSAWKNRQVLFCPSAPQYIFKMLNLTPSMTYMYIVVGRRKRSRWAFF